jgi:cytochrome bd ubiquinol oxidase subunit II
METVLPLVWFSLLGFTLILFVVLDGADLGIGVFFLGRDERDRPGMMDAIGPHWYANETWLVIAGAILFGAFPLAYSAILSSFYVPVMMLLFGLVLRASAIEFRAHSERKRLWEAVFGGGSLLAILGQGFILGGILNGTRMENAAGPWLWLNMTSLVIAAMTVAAHCTLGASYLSSKLEADAQARNRRRLKLSASITLGLFILAVALLLASPLPPALTNPYSLPLLLLAVIFSLIMLLRSTGRPYLWSIVAFLCTAAAIVCATFPFIIPFSLSIDAAAASSQTLTFMLFGVGAILPVIVVYNLYVRRVFGRKETGDSGKDGY